MLGALIGAGTSLASSFLGNKSAEKNAKRQEEVQREFAQNGIRWKVEDAKAAGIHPLYALGANTTSYSPTQVGGSDWSGLAQAGQDISRAIDTTRTGGERATAFTNTMQKLSLEKMGLENELLASQIAKTKQQIGPPMAGSDYLIPGQTGSGLPVPKGHEGKSPEFTTNLRAFGTDVLPNPAFSNAQAYEDRYGELSDYIAGPMIAVADYFYNMRNARFGNPFNFAHRKHKGKW